ncbi:uncharacterized protein LOC135814552 [Sycon ciliatum]|uniref:uncharacterized protein LOC135814552 n=1 Tax=Sycon ciliatum TaxID=27933 RepID=UPI0031F61B00|eukprot:scpid12532/ scgid33694/ Peroxidasin homolog; Melanoma-associated antigen MG50; Vascular peroxidase 1; p53-responsive gene 2 protein
MAATRCKLRQMWIIATVVLFHLYVAAAQDITVTVSPERRVVAAGRSVGFECGYVLPPGHRFTSVIWQNSKTGTTLPANRHQTTRDGILVIDRVTESDSGIYTCAVQSYAEHTQQTHRSWGHAALSVVARGSQGQVRPTVHVLPGGDYGGLVRLRPGQSVELTGLATGHPQPFITWKRASGKALPRNRHRIANGKLEITNVVIPDDIDEYVCTATNPLSSSQESRFLVGGWSSWGQWGMCSTSCGAGQQRRRRTCIVPPTLHRMLKRLACRGSDNEPRTCNAGACFVPTRPPPPPTTTPYRPPTRAPAPVRTRPPVTTRPPVRATPPPPREVVTQPLRVQTTPRAAPLAVTRAPSPPMAPGSGLKPVGCFRDHVGRRVLRFHYRNYWRFVRRMVPTLCVSHCQRYGHRYAGVENFAECFCGSMDVRSAVRSDQCTNPCGGNPGLACGGRNALSVYEVPLARAKACETSKWDRWTQLIESCGWAVQRRDRYLRNPRLQCPRVPNLRQERLIKIKPCPPDFSLTPSTCRRVPVTKRISYNLSSTIHCLSDTPITLYYCKGPPTCSRCTYSKTTSRNVKFTCGPARSKVTIRVAEILACRCR